MDSLYDAILNGTNKYEFDVNGDGTIDRDDIQTWLENAGEDLELTILPGDANLDGAVDTDDFDIWNQNRFTATSSFCGGDFNADGVADLSDLHIWNEFKFQSGTLIPEPSGWALVSLVWLLLLPLRHRR